MDVAVLSLSKAGSKKASELVALNEELNFDAYCLRIDDSISSDYQLINRPIMPWIESIFNNYSAIVLIMPVGIGVRLLAPLIISKHSDPAVVCIDDGGNFAISLLSGHLGGADELTLKISRLIKSQPIITSSSTVLNKLSIDLIGNKYSWKIDSVPKSVTAVSAEVINDGVIGVFQDAGDVNWLETLPKSQYQIFKDLNGLAASEVNAAIIVTDKIIDEELQNKLTSEMEYVLFRPPVLHLGIGCRKDTDRDQLLQFTLKILKDHGLSRYCVGSVSTIELKKEDPSINYVAASLGVQLTIHSSAAIEDLFDREATLDVKFSRSVNPKRLIGVWGVAEPTAILSSARQELIVGKHKSVDSTIAIAR